MGKGGAVSITANEKVVAEGHVGRTVPFRFSTEETLDIGEDTGTPVDLSYDVPAPFTGELGKVIIDLK
jgi:arylsulfatase